MARPLFSRVVIKKPKIQFKHFRKDTNVGYAYPADHKAEIEIKQSNKEFFLTVIHEVIGHLTLPDLNEGQVIRLERITGEALWKAVLRLRQKWTPK